MVKQHAEGARIEARVLLACSWGSADDVVTLTKEEPKPASRSASSTSIPTRWPTPKARQPPRPSTEPEESMYLKRLYGDAGRVSRVEIRHTGLSAEQNFSRRLVLQACGAGWMRLAGEQLLVVGDPEDWSTRSRARRATTASAPASASRSASWPGEQAVSQPAAVLAAAEARVARRRRPASNDYEVTMAYECVLAEQQHEKFRAVKAVSGNPVAAHTLEA